MTKKVFGEFGFEFFVEFRHSNFLTNFIGYLDFRVLTSKLYADNIEPTSIIVKQLGTDISWSLTPFGKNEDKETIWDYLHFKQPRQRRDPLAPPDKLDFYKEIRKGRSDDIQELSGVEVAYDIKSTLDYLYQTEQTENEQKEETFTFVNRKNRGFFFLSVPNETICIEVYSQTRLVGYAFFPMANMNFGQNYFEEIISLVPDANLPVLGNVLIRMNFYPIPIKTDLQMLGSLGSLDFDDISNRYSTPSGLFEACLLMDKNIQESKALIWPDKIENPLKGLKQLKRLILNVADIQNLCDVFNKELDFGSLSIKGKCKSSEEITF